MYVNSHLNVCGDYIISLTEDRKALNVYHLKLKKTVQTIQLKDHDSEKPDESLFVYRKVSNIQMRKFKEYDEEIEE